MKHILRYVLICYFAVAISVNVFAQTHLIIATNEYPPYISENSNHSCLMEIFKAIEKEMGVTFYFQFMPWPRCEASIEKLSAWGAIPYVPTPARKEKFDFSDKIYTRQSKFFYFSPDGIQKKIIYNTLGELKKYRIGGVRGYYYGKIFSDAGITLDLVNSEEQNFRKMITGRIDLAPSDETVGWYLIRTVLPREVGGKIFTVSKPFTVSDNFLMASKNYPEGLDIMKKFNSAMRKVKENGTFKKIIEKHNIAVTY
jgi:polar amino acid transport system substrate-binding protein